MYDTESHLLIDFREKINFSTVITAFEKIVPRYPFIQETSSIYR